MKMEARLRDQRRQVQISREGGRYRGRIGEREVEAEVLEDGKGSLIVRTDSRTFDVTYWKEGRELHLDLGEMMVAVKVQPGAEVLQGQGVVVVEAMKMENEVPSPRSGKVVALEVSPGQTVEKGALLFSIE